MDKQNKTFYNYLQDSYTPLKKGIDLQREIFKQSMIIKDYDTAISALENIRCEIKKKAIAKGNKQKIIRIYKIIQWYRIIPYQFSEKTENGIIINIPAKIEITIIKNLNIAYELTIDVLNILGLI